MRLVHQTSIVLAFSATTVFAANYPGAGLRFESIGNLVLVNGSIGDEARLRFAIDTGTSWTVVDQRIVARLALPTLPFEAGVVALNRGARASKAVVPSIAFGPIRLESRVVLVMDLRALRGRGEIDAIIGLDVLREANFQIDYRARCITFGSIREARSSVPFLTLSPLLGVEVIVDGRPLRVFVDTGARRLTLFAERLGRTANAFHRRGRLAVMGIAGPSRVDGVDLHRVQLGDTVFASYQGAVLSGADPTYEGFDGILGGLSQAIRRLGFDFRRGRLQWE